LKELKELKRGNTTYSRGEEKRKDPGEIDEIRIVQKGRGGRVYEEKKEKKASQKGTK